MTASIVVGKVTEGVHKARHLRQTSWRSRLIRKEIKSTAHHGVGVVAQTAKDLLAGGTDVKTPIAISHQGA